MSRNNIDKKWFKLTILLNTGPYNNETLTNYANSPNLTDFEKFDDEMSEMNKLAKFGSYRNKKYRFQSSGRTYSIQIDVIDKKSPGWIVTIYPNDPSQILSLPIKCDALDMVMLWYYIIKDAPFLEMTLAISKHEEYIDDCLVNVMNIKWDEFDDDKPSFYKKSKSMFYKRIIDNNIDPDHEDAYYICNAKSDSIKVYSQLPDVIKEDEYAIQIESTHFMDRTLNNDDVFNKFEFF